MAGDIPPNRGDRSFRAFLGVALWVIAAAVLLCLVGLAVLYF